MRVEQLENRWSQDQFMTGIELGNWFDVLKRNGWRVDPDYLHRAAWITGISLPATLFGKIDDLRFGRRINDMEIDPTPLIILGHWRSGTTHLHTMLGRDPNHTYTNIFQVIFPTSFLTTLKAGTALLKDALPEKRSYDNMPQGWFEPAEDEIALMKLTGGRSFYTALMFPDKFAEYEKYIDFVEATHEERMIWKNALSYFIKKVMIGTGNKRVILKSCPHSARIRMLLELFPNAKFLHIHRHPARVFQSTVHMRSKVDWENFMHRPEKTFIEQRREHTALIGERLFDRLLADKGLIPEENLIEIAYSDLIGNEHQVLKDIYRKFELPDWERFERNLLPYLDSIADYKTNRLTMDPEIEEFVYERWRPVYDAYGYKKEYSA